MTSGSATTTQPLFAPHVRGVFCSANLLTREQAVGSVYRLQLSIEVGFEAELRHGWEGLDAGAL